MILLVDLCHRENSLGFEEFVLPIQRIVGECGFSSRAIHYRKTGSGETGDATGIILCGTPVADNRFLADIWDFGWVPGCTAPILGICAGMEVLTLVHGGTLENCSEIGMTGIRVTGNDILIEAISDFEAYELHGFGCIVPPGFRVLAESDSCSQLIRHGSLPHVGVMFHPEVRNEWVIERFLSAFSLAELPE
jgi:GMP synthase-like glutamine amidotransferase